MPRAFSFRYRITSRSAADTSTLTMPLASTMTALVSGVMGILQILLEQGHVGKKQAPAEPVQHYMGQRLRVTHPV